MKLVFHDLGDLEMHLVSNPSMRFVNNGMQCHAASFTLEGNLTLEEGQELTGIIDLKSDDNMDMNTFKVADFLRYELNNYDEKCSLLLTNDPVPVPPPEPEPPTEEELLAQAKSGCAEQIYAARDAAIFNGVDVETSYGLEHFTLEEKDKTLLLGIYAMVMQGMTSYPYHSFSPTNGSTNICTVYSDEDIGKIAVAAFSHITYHESYANMLIQWLDRETDVNTVYTIEYGAVLPKDLIDYFAMILTSAGIPASMIPGYEAEVVEESADSASDSGTEA